MGISVSVIPILIFSTALAMAQAPTEGRRAAFVVGLAKHQLLPPIESSAANAAAIQAALRSSGFARMTVINDPTMLEFQAARDAFLRQIQPNDSIFVYFSGYGVAAIDEYYLLPRDFDPAKDIGGQGILLSTLVQSIEERKPAVAIVMLESSFRADALGKFSDANPQPGEPRKTSVWFADQWTAAGSLPAGNQVSPFTAEVAKAMAKEGSTPPVILDSARAALGNQTPKSMGPASAGFYFRAVREAPMPAPVIVEREQRKRIYQKDRVAYVKIPEGEFKMGCVPATEKECEPAERPQHTVKITKSYWMAESEVEVGSYKRYVDANKANRAIRMPPAPARHEKWATDNRPIVNVSWEQAQDYCQWLGGRLPTEAEWERAARAGRDNEAFPMKSLAEARDKANFAGKQGNDVFADSDAPVKKFDPNAYGLFDMSGNVWEWVSDFWGPYESTSAIQVDPVGPATGKDRVMRGGSFTSNPGLHLRLSFRKGEKGPINNVGFRCVLPDTPEVLSKMVTEQ